MDGNRWRLRLWPWQGAEVEIDVGSVDSFHEAKATIVTAGGKEIGVVRRGSEFYALRNICPHQGGPLCEGRVVSGLESPEVGAVRVVDHPIMMCAWHGWEFDVRSGRSLWDPSYRVKTYPVSVVGGRVIIEVESMTKGRHVRQS